MDEMRKDVQAPAWDADTEKAGKKTYSRPQLSVITVGDGTEQGGLDAQDGSVFETKGSS